MSTAAVVPSYRILRSYIQRRLPARMGAVWGKLFARRISGRPEILGWTRESSASFYPRAPSEARSVSVYVPALIIALTLLCLMVVEMLGHLRRNAEAVR